MRVKGVDTQIKHEPPLGVVPVPPRGLGKSGERHCLVVEACRPPVNFAIHNDSGVNLLRGLVERVYFVPTSEGLKEPPRPVSFADDMRGAFVKLVRACPVLPCLTRDEFVSSYVGDRRRWVRYEQARVSLEHHPLELKDSMLDTFVKCEKINFSKKTDPAPRVIQPRRPRFGLEFGRYMKPLEHVLYKHMGQRLYGHPCVAKGFNASSTAKILREKWEMFDRPVAVSMDASRFDQHVSVDALQWTHAVYRRFFPGDPVLPRILSMMIENKGVASAKDAAFKYSVVGRRMSGDMDTALGNCLLMTCMTWSYCQRLGIRHQVFDNGDDIVVVFEQERLAEFQAGVVDHYKRLGFTMVVEAPVYEFEQIDFCQTHPVFDGQDWVMCRDVTSISKDLVCTIGTSDIRPWLGAVGACGLSLTSGLPIYQSFYLWCVRSGRVTSADRHPNFACGMSRLAFGMTPRVRVVQEAARVSFCLAFGILPDAQVAIEQYWDSLDVVGGGITEDSQVYGRVQELCCWYEREKCLTYLGNAEGR